MSEGTSGDSTELQPLDESVITPPLLLHQRVYQRLAAVRWMSLVTAIMTCVSVFILYSSISLIATFFPTTAADKGAPPYMTGLVIAMAPLSSALFAPILGYFMPKLGRSFTVTTGLCVVGATYITFGATIYLPSGWPFVFMCAVLRFMEGIGIALFSTGAFYLLVQLYPDSVGLMMGIKETSSGLGFICGPVIGGFLYLAGGYKVPFFVVGGVCLLLSIPTFLILTKSTNNASETKRALHLKLVLKVLTNFTELLLVLVNFLLLAALGFLIATYSVFLKKEFSQTPDEIGLMFLAISLPFIICAPIAGKCADKTSPRIVILTGLFLCGTGLQLLGPTSVLPIKSMVWLSVLGGIIVGVGFGTAVAPLFPDAYAVAKKDLQDLDDPDSLKGVIVGLLSSGSYLGQFLGPIIGGGLTSVLDFQASTSICGEVVLAEMVTLLLVSVIDLYLSRSKPSHSGPIERDLTNKQFTDK